MEQKTQVTQILPVLKQSPYFTKQNLALVLGKEGEALNYWIKKLLDEKLLIPLKKGLYTSSYYRDMVKQSPGEYEAYLEYMANVLRAPSYVSLEYVLSKRGFLAEEVFAVTSVTIKSTREYETDLGKFIYRSLKEDLFYGWETQDFRGQEVKVASFAKALFDFWYLRPQKRGWREYFLSEGRFNWEVFSFKDQSDFTKMVQAADSKKMVEVLNFLQREGLIFQTK